MQLHQLKASKGARKRRKIVGRGRGSGHGKTSGRGHKGQGARPGRGILLSLEGGQMPLIKRLPKVGFRSKRPVENQVVKLECLTRFKEGTVINAEFLKNQGLIKSLKKPFKILGNGEIKKPLVIEAGGLSEKAKDKIINAGGKIEDQKSKTKKQEINT